MIRSFPHYQQLDEMDCGMALLMVPGYYSLLVLGIFLLGNTLYILWVTFFLRYRRELDFKRFNQSATERNKMIQLIQVMRQGKIVERGTHHGLLLQKGYYYELVKNQLELNTMQ